MDELRKKTVVGSFWTLFERFGYLGIQFISNLVLARLLMPDDFGTIGILTIFTSLSSILIDSGLSSALIQKSEIDEDDKATVFFTNLALAVAVYLVVFFSSPFIARFFHNPDLCRLLRVIELMVVIDAFAAIQSTTLCREMNFKSLAQYKIISIVIAVAVSIVLAYLGMGVWALVVQYLLFSFCRALLLWSRTKWKPVFSFSRQSFKSLFGYGSNLLVSSYVATLYDHFLSILLGRNFSASKLGYYTQAKQLMQIPVDSLARVVNNVSFPAYSKIQNERGQLKVMVRQNLLILIFVNTPLMFYLSTVAKPLLVFLYSEKWMDSIPFFQFLCIGYGVLSIVHNSSLTALKSVGRTDCVLKLEIYKKILGVCLLCTGMHFFGIWGLMYGLAVNSFIELFLNGHYLKKEIDYGVWEQIKDLSLPLVLAIVSSLTTCVFLRFVPISGNLLNLVITFFIFGAVYLSGACLFKLESLDYVKKIIVNLIRRAA